MGDWKRFPLVCPSSSIDPLLTLVHCCLLRPAVHLSQKRLRNANNKKCIARYFASLFSHFVPGLAFVWKVKGWLYFFVFRILWYFANVFTKHTVKYETLAIHFHISCEFRVLLMPQKNKPRNPLTFRTNLDPGAQCCEMRKKWHEILRYTLFIFRILR